MELLGVCMLWAQSFMHIYPLVSQINLSFIQLNFGILCYIVFFFLGWRNTKRRITDLAGKEKNFVYSHSRPTARVYEAHPKPEGIAFGGSFGNERILMDEDFSRLTLRHHAVDKTYQHGTLIPKQVNFRCFLISKLIPE